MVTTLIHRTTYSNLPASIKQECKYHWSKKKIPVWRFFHAELKGGGVSECSRYGGKKITGLVKKQSILNCVKMTQMLLNKGTGVTKVLLDTLHSNIA